MQQNDSRKANLIQTIRCIGRRKTTHKNIIFKALGVHLISFYKSRMQFFFGLLGENVTGIQTFAHVCDPASN